MDIGGIIAGVMGGAVQGAGNAMAEEGRNELKQQGEMSLVEAKAKLERDKEIELQKLRDSGAMARTNVEQQGATARNDTTNRTHVDTTRMTNETSRANNADTTQAHVKASKYSADASSSASRYSADQHLAATQYSADKGAETRVDQSDKINLGSADADVKMAQQELQTLQKKDTLGMSASQKAERDRDLTAARMALDKAARYRDQLRAKLFGGDNADSGDINADILSAVKTSTGSTIPPSTGGGGKYSPLWQN